MPHENLLTMYAPRPGRVYSQWDILGHRPSSYGLEVQRGLLRGGLNPRGMVLALGLGGGGVQGDILCHGLARKVVSVEISATVITEAKKSFFPAMFGDVRCRSGARRRMHVLLGDATNETLLRTVGPRFNGSFGGVVADIGPVYLSPLTFGIGAWRAVLSQTDCGGVLVCNTLYARYDEVLLLFSRLRAAGWSDTVAEPTRQQWSVGRNVLVYARHVCGNL